MKIPKGTGFDLAGGFTITLILSGGYFLVGTFLGVIDDERDYGDKTKFICPPTKVKIENEVEFADGAEFILLQLVCPFSVTGLPFFATGTIVAVDVEQVLFIATGTSCAD